jgi:copper chaperone
MTCGHCLSTITKAVHAVDADAEVETDLAMHEVRIESGMAGAVIEAAIRDAGYTPVASAQ